MLKIIKPEVSRKEFEALARDIEGILWGILGIVIIWPIIAIAISDINSIVFTVCFAAMTILSGMCIFIAFKTDFRKNVHLR